MQGDGEPWRCKKKETHFSQQKILTRVTVAFLINPIDEITIYSLLKNALFIRCFKLICTARVIDCKHRPQ